MSQSTSLKRCAKSTLLRRSLLVLLYFWLFASLLEQFQTFLFIKDAEAVEIKRVQRGTVTFTSGANRMAVTLPQSVDISKTIVWGGISHGGGRVNSPNANATRIGFDLESTTTLALERLGSPANAPVVEWQAVEFTSGVTVQRGLRSLTTAETTVNVTLSPAVDLTKSFVFVSVAPNSTSAAIDEQWTIRSRLTSTTNLELSRNESGIAVDVYWQVIQMDGASVQRNISTIPSGQTSATVSISSVDPSKSFLIMSYKGAAATNGAEAQYAARGTITNGTTLTFNRVSTTNGVDIAWEVVTMSDGTSVQRGSASTTSTSNTLLIQNVASVDLARALVYLSIQGGSGTTNTQLDETSWTGTLASPTHLWLQRAGTGTQGTVNWQVIQFASTVTNTAWDKGLAWLITHQEPDGSWKSTPATEFAVTASALEAFANAGLKNFSYAQGVSWLANAPALSVDSLARQISALTQAPINVTLYLQKLVAWRNVSKSWGAYSGYEPSFPDTPLALSAIRKAAYVYTDTDLTDGVCRMLQAQKTGDATINGSWSFIWAGTNPPPSAHGSSILPTAYNISEIAFIKAAKNWTTRTCPTGTFNLQTAIDNGVNWLLTQKRKADGGFGDGSVSTVLETAHAYRALREVRPSDAATEGALTYLLNAQNTDGSWNNEALQTAFVLQSLPPPSPYSDTDNDGLPDRIETILGTNPNVPDSRDLGGQGFAGMQMPMVIALSNESLRSQDETDKDQGLADGDLNGDGSADAADLAIAERIALGLAIPTESQMTHGDVSPSGKPDGVIDVDDVARIRRKVLGLENF